MFLLLTIVLGFIFFGIKYVEYARNSTTISFPARISTSSSA